MFKYVESFKTGIQVLDEILPNGIPRNNMVLILGEGGTGKSVLITHLMYARLLADEPCIFICFDDIPIAVIQLSLLFKWNLLEYANRDLLRFIDCFSFRMAPDRSTIPPYITYIENPRDLYGLVTAITNLMDKLNMNSRGAVFIDSLTELLSLTETTIALEVIKILRAECSKERNVPIFGTFHFGVKPFDDVEQILEYIVDGIIDLRYDPHYMQQGFLVKQFRVRKMKGVPHSTNWVSFSINSSGIFKIT
ncbi:MAG: RAD55 family ATPase [Candidatus Methanomethylicia archaeon]|nr:RAD55 family ATPase [Candidatus Methanomethylicia archaeon]